jgi:2-keto-4-pentenoate hydratase/2-oxohepta-3-ene-1,7-dioic acid hydratase in catechol pathway
MKYATFSLPNDSAPRLGVVDADRLFDVTKLVAGKWPGPAPSSLLELIQAGPDAWRRLADVVKGELSRSVDGSHRLDTVRLHAPIPRPAKNVFCMGINYVSHMEEGARARGREAKIPEYPVFFTKAPTAVNGPYDPIPWHRSVTNELDHEVEMGAIIGLGGIYIPREKALDHVFGYTAINDISAREVQKNHFQWFKGKSLDGSCPMGPWVVTADEFGDPQNKQLTLRVDGEVRQSSNTKYMIFPVNAIIESLSKGITLEPGDIIATGTPEGVGLGRTPPLYLKDGELVETFVEGVGTMRNRVEAV